jgi:hypothetical protein
MLIANRTYRLLRTDVTAAGGIAEAIAGAVSGEPLRWFVSSTDETTIEAVVTECVGFPPSAIDMFPPLPPSGRAAVISLIPTGIGCAFGGYAGDAGPVTALLGAAADVVVTNPNAVNASDFIHLDDRVIYLEGYSLDLFARGMAPLYRPRSNRVGVIVERADQSSIDHVSNVINAVRAIHGVDIDCLVTDEPIGTRCVRHESGAYGGQVDHPEVLLEAGRRLIDAGATALAVTTNVCDLPSEDYARNFVGAHPNPVGGAEAVVSHLLTRTLGVPSAHAPMMNFKSFGATVMGVVDARAAGEFVSASGLACVLMGLRRSPQLAPKPGCPTSELITTEDVIAVVAPASALGSAPVLSAVRRGTPVIAVRENETVLDVTARALGLDGVIEVDSYLAAAGLVVALRSGIGVDGLRRPLAAVGDRRVGDELGTGIDTLERTASR